MCLFYALKYWVFKVRHTKWYGKFKSVTRSGANPILSIKLVNTSEEKSHQHQDVSKGRKMKKVGISNMAYSRKVRIWLWTILIIVAVFASFIITKEKIILHERNDEILPLSVYYRRVQWYNLLRCVNSWVLIWRTQKWQSVIKNFGIFLLI